MVNCYQKFYLELLPYDYASLKGKLAFQYGYPDVTIFLYYINDIEKFRSLHAGPISKIPPTRVFYSEIIGQGFLQPHKDLGVGCNLNWYFQTDESATVFYQEKENAKHLSNFMEEGENVFHLEDLEEVARFTAEKNTAYLLNVDRPHSVYKPNFKIRKFFSYQWLGYNYQTILDSLLIKKEDCLKTD